MWNDVLQSVKSANLFRTMLLVTLSCNSAWGPWGGEKWFHVLREAWSDFEVAATAALVGKAKATDGSTTALLESLAPKILVESGELTRWEVEELAPADVAEQALELIRAAPFLHKKGTRVATCRWFSFLAALEELLPCWSAKTLVCAHANIAAGLMDGDVVAAELDRAVATTAANVAATAASASTDGPGDGDVGHLQRDKMELQRFRDGCKNTLQAVGRIHLSGDLLAGACIILVGSKPFRAWQSEVAHSCRSPSANASMLLSLCHGAEPLRVCRDVMVGVGSGLEVCGYIGVDGVANLLTGVTPLTVDSPLVLSQDALVDRAGRFAVALLSRRMSTLMQYWTFPLRFFRLLVPRDDDNPLRDVGEMLQAWSRCKGWMGQFWTRLRWRSCFQWVLVQDIMACLTRSASSSSSGGGSASGVAATAAVVDDLPPVVRELLERLSRGFLTTKIVEDSFNKARSHEARMKCKQQGGSNFYFSRCYGSKLLSELYHYAEVSPDDSTLQPQGAGAHLPRPLFAPCVRALGTAIPEAKRLHRAKADWPTFSAQSMVTLAAELEFMRLCAAEEAQGLASRVSMLWRCKLFRPGLVVQHVGSSSAASSSAATTSAAGSSAVSSSAPYFVVFVHDVLLVLWPLRCESTGHMRTLCFESLRSYSALRFASVIRLSEWQVLPTAWWSNLHIGLASGALPARWPKSSLAITGDAVPVLEHLARDGFNGVPAQVLRKLLSSDEVPAPTSAAVAPSAAAGSAKDKSGTAKVGKSEKQSAPSEVEIRVEAVRRLLKCTLAEAALHIEDGVVATAAGDSAEADLSKMLASDDVQACFDEDDREKVIEATSKPEKKAVKQAELLQQVRALRASAVAATAAARQRRPVRIPHLQTWTPEAVKAHLPPRAKIYCDSFNGRWQIWLQKWSHSASWGHERSDKDCILQCLRAAWQRYSAISGQPAREVVLADSPAS